MIIRLFFYFFILFFNTFLSRYFLPISWPGKQRSISLFHLSLTYSSWACSWDRQSSRRELPRECESKKRRRAGEERQGSREGSCWPSGGPAEKMVGIQSTVLQTGLDTVMWPWEDRFGWDRYCGHAIESSMRHERARNLRIAHVLWRMK